MPTQPEEMSTSRTESQQAAAGIIPNGNVHWHSPAGPELGAGPMYRRILPHHSPFLAATSCVAPGSLQGLAWQELISEPARHT